MHHSRLIARLAGFSLAVMFAQTGCVMPGGLRGVGGQYVEGRLVDTQGQGLPNAEIIVLQGHFDRLDAKTVAYLSGVDGPDKVERVVVWTDSQGRFAHKFAGFTHCHPTWFFPPLLTLPSQLTGATRHGAFFVLQTPDPGGQIYEITVGNPPPAVLVFDRKRGRLTQPAKAPGPEQVKVQSEMVPWVYDNGRTSRVERVQLEIVRSRLP